MMQQSQTAPQTEHQRSSERLEKVFDQRVKSLVEDGYCVRFTHKTHDLMMCRLHHMSNGNDVIVKGYPTSQRIVQFTNHVLVHHEQLLY